MLILNEIKSCVFTVPMVAELWLLDYKLHEGRGFVSLSNLSQLPA